MVAEEFSQGSPLGLENSGSAGGDPPAGREIPNLRDVLGEFMEALCVVEMVHRALEERMAESSEEIGSYAIALRHGFQLLDAVYSRFDLGLLGYESPGGDDDPDHDLNGDDHDGEEAGEPGGRGDERDGRDPHANAVADNDRISGVRKQHPELHPAYGVAITAQASRLQDVRSILDCAKYALVNDPDEVDATGAVIVAHETLNNIIDELDSVSLRRSAERWLADQSAAADAH